MAERKSGQPRVASNPTATASAVSRREQAETGLRLLHDSFEQSSAAIVITDPAGRIEYVNSQFQDLTGYSSEDLIGADISALSDERPEVKEQIWRTLGAGRRWHGEVRSTRKTGESYSSHASVSPVRNTEGMVTHFIGVHEEISDRQRGEETRRGAEGSSPSVADAVADYVMVVDLDGTILFMNGAAPGITREEATGSSLFEHVVPGHHETLTTYMGEVARAGKALSFEVAGLGPYGTTSIYDVRLGPIKRRGQVIALSISASDITERRRPREVLPRHGETRENGGARQAQRGNAPQSRVSAGAAALGARNLPDLSPREVEVLEFLAQGLTNRQIAVRLRLSTRTIDHHVSHILSKLNVPNRTAAVAAAERTEFLRA